MTDRIALLKPVIRGWINYFSIGVMKGKMEKIDEHLRTMLRKAIWKQWKTPQKRAWGLRMGSQKNLRCTSNLKRDTDTQRLSKLS